LFACVSVLLLAGCATSRPQPAYLQDPQGNAWLLPLPKGSTVTVGDPKLLAPAFNEIENGKLIDDCYLVSKSYIYRRDEQELELLRIIEELKIK
jgi:hypothetical protein